MDEKDLADILVEKILDWNKEHLKITTHLHSPRPMIIGISGPQGIGKSTLSHRLKELLDPFLESIFISIDDFYYPYDILGPNQRGPPGTHDLDLLYSTLDAMKANMFPLTIPKYDKTLQGGHGDRMSKSHICLASVEVVFLEGWLIGMQSPSFHHYQHTVDFLDHFVHLIPLASDMDEQFDWVVHWRMESERCLSKDQVKDLVNRIWPFYKEGYFDLKSTCLFSQVKSGYPHHHVQVLLDRTRKFQKIREF